MRRGGDMALLDCGHEPSEHTPYSTGYGMDNEGRRHCYACCAENDRRSMRDTGRAVLYLTLEEPAATHCGNRDRYGKVTNWPGSLELPVLSVSKGRHNIARVRYDVWFRFEGAAWHGVQYGDNTQICHCKRLKGE